MKVANAMLLSGIYFPVSFAEGREDGVFGPYEVNCPKYDLIRIAKGNLCDEEANYLKNRQKLTQPKIVEFLEGLTIPNFEIDQFLQVSDQPIGIGMALSGGGYRSMLTGSGFLLKMEEYGVADCLSYISGISGGSWMLMSLILNDFNITSLESWVIEDSLLKGIPDIEVHDKDIVSQINANDVDEILNSDEWFYNQLTETSGISKRERSRDGHVFEEFFEQLEEFSEYSGDDNLAKRTVNPFIRFKDAIIEFFKTKEPDANETSKMGGVIGSFQNFRTILEFYIKIHLEVRNKKMKGFPLSFTDYWGRALIRHIAPVTELPLVNGSLSQILERSQKFQSFQMPLPIIVSNCKNGFLKGAVFEFTPFEFGSWNSVGLFVKIKYLGSKIVNGIPAVCINGFDDISFITATSSSLFNNVLIYIWQLVAPSLETRKAVRAIISTFGLDFRQYNNQDTRVSHTITRPEYALYQPNPFYKFPGFDSVLTSEPQLHLVDGGEDGENIPIRSLAITERQLDLVFALDVSSDKNNYPNGSMLRNLYDHSISDQRSENSNFKHGHQSSLSMPYIPTSEVFVSQNLLRRPVAFGCYLTSFSSNDDAKGTPPNLEDVRLPPILIYHANFNHSFVSNTSTFKLRYSDTEVEGMLQNGRNIFSFDSDPLYRRCMGCILLKRTYDRHKMKAGIEKPPPFCQKCYREFCYN